MKIIALMGLLALASCASADPKTAACENQAGPQPYAWAPAFGLIGYGIAQQQPETVAWHHRVAQCEAAP